MFNCFYFFFSIIVVSWCRLNLFHILPLLRRSVIVCCLGINLRKLFFSLSNLFCSWSYFLSFMPYSGRAPTQYPSWHISCQHSSKFNILIWFIINVCYFSDLQTPIPNQVRQNNFRPKCIYVAVMLRRMMEAILNKDAMDDKV